MKKLKFVEEVRDFFKEFLQSKDILKIGFSVHSDTEAIKRTFQSRIKDFQGFVSFEEELLLCRTSNTLGLTSHCMRIFGKKLDKSHQEWVAEMETLTEDELHYCAMDAVAPLQIWNRLRRSIHMETAGIATLSPSVDLSEDKDKTLFIDFPCKMLVKTLEEKSLFNVVLLSKDMTYQQIIDEVQSVECGVLVSTDKYLLSHKSIKNPFPFFSKKEFMRELRSAGAVLD